MNVDALVPYIGLAAAISFILALRWMSAVPTARRGVIVGIHDIFLPDDYPADWAGRYYSEQYLLACYLLAETKRFDVLLPVHFANARGLCDAVMPQPPGNGTVAQTGSSFWLELQ